MGRNDVVFVGEKSKKENEPINLYTIFDYDGNSTNLYLAEYDKDVVYDGINYVKFPITHDPIGENIEGTIDAVTIKLSNVSRLIQAYLELYDFSDKKVTIKHVWANQLDDPDAHFDDIHYIDSYTADQHNAEFTLTSKFDVVEVELPAEKYSRHHCRYKTFGGTRCGYAGAETECNRTLQRCRVLANQRRFGGQPSVPSKRIFVG